MTSIDESGWWEGSIVEEEEDAEGDMGGMGGMGGGMGDELGAFPGNYVDVDEEASAKLEEGAAAVSM